MPGSDTHAAKVRYPLVLVIRAMKSGTTALFDYLSQHSQICAASHKEPNFFADRQQHVTTFYEYEALWNWKPGQHRFALEASTAYTKYPWTVGVPERIEQLTKDVRLIYLVRDPVARAESHYRFMRDRVDFRKRAVAADGLLSSNLVYYSDYSLQLDQYTPHVSPETILVLQYEDFRNAPMNLLRTVEQFLELKPIKNPVAPKRINATKPQSAALSAAMRWDRKYGNWRSRLPAGLRRAAKGVLQKMDSDEGNLKPHEREAIYEHLRQSMYRMPNEWELI